MLIAFYLIIEVLQYRKWPFPLPCRGDESIFIYFGERGLARCWTALLACFTFHYSIIESSLRWRSDYRAASDVYLCYWLYKRRIFSQTLSCSIQ